MKNRPLVSIIVPIYNASKHITILVDSVRRQRYMNWELLLVDDGSNDDSFDVCKRLSFEDDRVKVFHQENQGPSAARNLGIISSSGDWVTFVDADDLILDNYISSMVDILEENLKDIVVDMVCLSYLVADNAGNNIFSYRTQVYSSVKDAISNTSILHRCSPWAKLFRKSVILDHNISFDVDLKHSEDRLFVYNYLLYARGIATTSTIGYLYDSTQVGSLKNKVLSVEMLYSRQKKLTTAAKKIIDRFQLSDEESYQIIKHITLLYATSVHGFYYALGNKNQTINEQRKFYLECFDRTLYSRIEHTKLWQKQLYSTFLLFDALRCNFRKINHKLSVIDTKIKVSRFINIFRKKNKAKSFLNVITFLN